MFWKDRIGKEKSDAPYYEKSRVLRRNMKNKKSPTSGIIDWADRIIRQIKTKEKAPSRSASVRPIPLILILTLTVLVALFALFCIYK